MAERKRTGTQAKGTKGRAAKPPPGFERATPPEATNRDHAETRGARTTVPGAGVVGAGADAGPRETGGGGRRRSYPGRGKGRAPKSAPGALRPGTTDSGPARTANTRGTGGAMEAGIGHVGEATPAGGGAPLSDYDESVGPAGGRTGTPEIADPNFTAATRGTGRTPVAGTAGFDTEDPAKNGPGAAQRAAGGRGLHGAGSDAARVRDVMSGNVEVCEPTTELRDAARMMADRDVGAIPVVQTTDTMKPVGMITDRDITVRVVARGQDPYALTVSAAMSSGVFTISRDASVAEAIELMEREQVRRLIVTDESGRCAGIIAQADVVQVAPAEKTGELVQDISKPIPRGHGAYH